MKITGENGIGKILKIFLQVCFYCGIIILVGLPFLLNKLGCNLGASMYVIYPNGIVLLMITHKFINLFNSLRLNNPFCEENVKILKTTGIISLIGSLLWLIDFLYEIILVHSEDIIFNMTFSYKTGLELNGIISLDSKYESPICSHSLFDDFNMYSLLKVIFCSSK